MSVTRSFLKPQTTLKNEKYKNKDIKKAIWGDFEVRVKYLTKLFFSSSEWSESKLPIWGQPGSSSLSCQKWEHAMRFLFVAIQRQS